MSIAIAQHAKASHASSAVTAGVTTQAAGSSFVIGVACSAGSFTSVADSKSNIYTQIGTEQSSSGHAIRWYLCTNGTGGASHTATVVASFPTCYFAEITGGLTASILDQQNQGTDATSPYGDAVTITTTQAAELILAIVSGDGSSNPLTYTLGNSFTAIDAETDGSSFWTSSFMQRVVAATGTYNISATASGSTTDAVVLIASFKEAAGAAANVGQPWQSQGGMGVMVSM